MPLRLFIPTMDAVLVDFREDGAVQLEGEDWSAPNLQERRAIIFAARQEIERLQELMAALDPSGGS